MPPVLPPAPRRAPDAHEIRRPQTRPRLRALHERFHQPGPVAVARREVPRQAAQHAPRHMAGQIRAARPDQEPTQADHPVQVRPPLHAIQRSRAARRSAEAAKPSAPG